MYDEVMESNDSYYAQSRPEMLTYIPPDTKTLIDIGCGGGRFGAGVKELLPDCEVWGLEAVESVAKEAEQRADKMICSTIEKAADILPSAYFDVVTMNDVLEHLPYPEPALELLRRILKPNGRLVMSLPNVRYYINVKDLLFKKDWAYQDFGVLDRTHLKFYTQKSAVRTLEQNGFKTSLVQGINGTKIKAHYRALFALAPGFFRDTRTPQFAMVAHLAN